MEIAQGYARRPKRIYAVETCGFFHFVITLGYPFCTNFLQTLPMKEVQLFSYFVVLCWFLKYVSLKLVNTRARLFGGTCHDPRRVF